ncbi:MAG: hypothetical protein HY823_03345 [Acidobacteria bacterium]|nr:hypothetical protein [Acidobacteriota bacterium]
MSFPERLCLHLATLLTAATGLAYGWFRYFGLRPGDFGPEPHPLQGALQHLHLLLSPALVFLLGALLRSHVFPGWRSGKNAGRHSGAFLALGMAPMILSGYAIQAVTDPAWRAAFAWIHGVSSLLFVGAYLLHALLAWARGRREKLEMPA